MIKINSIGFSNILSYGTNNVFRVGSGVTQLVGENGAGKSSIPTILEEALYNKNSRGIKKSELVNRYTKDKTYAISVQFDVGQDHYFLDKRVGSTSKVKLFKNDEEISGHTTTQTYKTVETTLGMDFTTFTKLVYQSISSSLDFLGATDANRKKFLISLLGLEDYVETEKTLKEALKQQKEKLDNVQGAATAATQWLETNSVIAEVQKLITVPENDPQLLKEKMNIHADLTNLELSNKVRKSNNTAHDVWKTLIDNPVSVISIVPNSSTPLLVKHQAFVRELDIVLAEHKKLSLVKNKCPTCKQSIDIDDTLELLARAKTKVDYITLDVKRSKLELASAQALESKYKTYEIYWNKLAKATEAYDPTIDCEILQVQILQGKMSDIDAKIATQTSIISAANAKNRKVDIHNTQVQILRDQFDTFTKQVVKNEAELKEAKILYERLKVLTESMGGKGLIAYKIESMVKVFEDLINEYLQVLADGKFALGFKIDDSKLQLNLYDNGIEVDIKSLSSGEFNKVNTSTLLAVRKMMTSISKVDIDLLFLDEVVSVLDEQGKDTLIEVLLNETNLCSIVVSHGYTHPLASRINVIKKDKISELINE